MAGSLAMLAAIEAERNPQQNDQTPVIQHSREEASVSETAVGLDESQSYSHCEGGQNAAVGWPIAFRFSTGVFAY